MSIKEKLNDVREKVVKPAEFQLQKISLARQMLDEIRETNRLLRILVKRHERKH